MMGKSKFTMFTLRMSVGAVLIAGSVAMADITINEIRIDQSGTDLDEFLELTGVGGASLDGLTYIVIGDGFPGGSGVIEAVISLDGLSIPGDGFFFAAEDDDTFGELADLIADLNFENSDNVTHMLLRGFTGALADDLDLDDDGTLDITPWSDLLDSVALIESFDPGSSGFNWWYSDTTVGPDGIFVPAQIFLFPNGNGEWNIGAFSPDGGDTPGIANIPAPASLAILAMGGTLAFSLRRRRGH